MPDSPGEMPDLRAPPPGHFRAGGRVLSVFSAPLNALILEEFAAGEPLRLAELRAKVGCPAQTTLRNHLDELVEIGAVAKLQSRAMPYAVAHQLSGAPGRDLLAALAGMGAWLAQAPQGGVELGTGSAKGPIKALANGWSTGIFRALVPEPRSLTELDEMISALSYPAIDRRLQEMRLTGLIEPTQHKQSNRTPYTPTAWARQAIAPLCLAGQWERRHLPNQTAPITWVEVETAFLLALPLVKLPPGLKGECVLAAETKDNERRFAGVHIVIEDGQILTCEAQLKPKLPIYALGLPESWLNAVIEGQAKGLQIKGERDLVVALVKGLHRALFGS